MEFVKEVKEIMVMAIPCVAPTGANGILMLSLGAGIGEEALFRGFLMPFLFEWDSGERVRGRGSGDICEFRGDISHIWRVARDYAGVSGLGNRGWVLVWVGVLARWVRERDVHALFLRFHRFCVYCFVVGGNLRRRRRIWKRRRRRCCAFNYLHVDF